MGWSLLRDSAANADDDWRTLGTLPAAGIIGTVGIGPGSDVIDGIKLDVEWTNDAGVHILGGGSITLTLVELLKVGDLEVAAYGQSIVASAGLLYTMTGIRRGRFTTRATSLTPPTNGTRYRVLWSPF